MDTESPDDEDYLDVSLLASDQWNRYCNLFEDVQ